MIRQNLNFRELPRPRAAFSRATRLRIGETDFLFVSGTASVGPRRESRFVHSLEAQARWTYHNIAGILGAAGFSFHDVVRWHVYLRDMRDYSRFNRVRDAVFAEHGCLGDPPASTCVQARLCRPELRVEIEALAVRPARRKPCRPRVIYHPVK